ncbi:hypothetical protein V3C99_015438, partial [Haemonchus contortus]
AEALQRVLRLAYDRCEDWTEFLYVTDGISKHERIDDYCFDRTYDEGLKSLKRDLDEQEKTGGLKSRVRPRLRRQKMPSYWKGTGSRRGIITKVATSFEKLRDVLDELKACSRG